MIVVEDTAFVAIVMIFFKKKIMVEIIENVIKRKSLKDAGWWLSKKPQIWI